MRLRIAVPDEHVSPEIIEPALETVTRLNESMIRNKQTPTATELIRGGAIWRPENMGDEHFDHGGTIASRGWGDCDDWAPLKAAELRASGEDPGAKAIVVPSGPNTYHAIVRRSDGSIDDPSVAAGMKGHKSVSGDAMSVYACDPHDGRIYQGSLAPTVGPLTMHCGPGLSLRGCHVVGAGRLFEARVDMPLNGSRLVHVHSYWRKRPRHRVSGALPYALSVSNVAASPMAALNGALVGAVLCGDAAEMTTDLDRYKLLALQSAMAGMSAGEVHEALQNAMIQDMHAAAAESGRTPESHAEELLAQTPAAHMVIGGLFSAIGHIASSIVSDVSKVASSVAKAAGSVPWGDIIHGVEAAVSVVPGLGTAVSDVVAAAETAYETAAAVMSGNPFEGAIHAAYNFATASIPGAASLRIILDPIVNQLISLTHAKQPIESHVLDALLAAVPDAPKIGPLSPRSVAASLAHLIVSHLGVKKTPGHVPVSKPASRGVAAKPPPRPVVPPRRMPAIRVPPPLPKKPGVAHAAIAVHSSIPPHPTAAQAPSLAKAPGTGTTWHCAPLPGGHWACAWQ